MRKCGNNIDVTLLVYTNSRDLPVAWDSFIPKEHFLQREALAVTEQASLPRVSFLYVLINDASGQPLAASYFQLLSIHHSHINEKKLEAWQQLSWKGFTALAKPKLLIAGHLFRHDVESFYYDKSLSAFDAYQLYTKAIDKALRTSCASAVLIKDTAPELVTYFQHYAPQYMLLRNDISMEMNLPPEWETLADYEKALKHKYAQRFRKVRTLWSQLSIQELSATEVKDKQAELFKLYNQVTENQQVRLGYLSPEYLPQLKQHYDSQLKVWAAYDDSDKMVAFFSAWVKDEAFDMFYIGFDYARNNELQLYFNILFFSIEKAIEYRKTKLILGRTALDAKARLGCKPRYLNTFVYISNRWLRTIAMRLQQSNTTSEGEWESRHPLKK